MKVATAVLVFSLSAGLWVNTAPTPAQAQLNDVLNALSKTVAGKYNKRRQYGRYRGSNKPILAKPPALPKRKANATNANSNSVSIVAEPELRASPKVTIATQPSRTSTTTMALPVRRSEKPRLKSDQSSTQSVQSKQAELTPAPPQIVWENEQIIAEFARCERLLKKIHVSVKPTKPVRNGRCGMPAPVVLNAIGEKNQVRVNPPATLNCQTVVAIHKWIETVVQPAAQQAFKSPVVRIHNVSSYACRNRNNSKDGRLSEHAIGNALDVASFELADGQKISVLDGWGAVERDEPDEEKKAVVKKGSTVNVPKVIQTSASTPAALVPIPVFRGPVHRGVRLNRTPDTNNTPAIQAAASKIVVIKPKPSPRRAFLHQIHKSACGIFGTVLGPEANDHHRDHFHIDTAERTHSAYCR